MDKVYVEVRTNLELFEAFCPICGNRHRDASRGIWLFCENSNEPICSVCAEAFCDDLLDAVLRFNHDIEKREASNQEIMVINFPDIRREISPLAGHEIEKNLIEEFYEILEND